MKINWKQYLNVFRSRDGKFIGLCLAIGGKTADELQIDKTTKFSTKDGIIWKRNKNKGIKPYYGCAGWCWSVGIKSMGFPDVKPGEDKYYAIKCEKNRIEVILTESEESHD